MSHARQLIRDKVVALLGAVDDVTVVGSRVYRNITLPVISVYTRAEVATPENQTLNTPRRYSRKLALNVEIAVSYSEQSDAMADVFAARVEQVLAADPTLGDLATDIALAATNTDINGEGEKPVFTTVLIYEIWYRTTAAEPGTPI